MGIFGAVHRYFHKHALDAAMNGEDGAKIARVVLKGAKHPDVVDTLSPDHVSVAMNILYEDAESLKFLELGAALHGKPHKLANVDKQVMLEGIHAAVSDGHTSPTLLVALAAFEANNPNNRQRLVSGVGSGVYGLIAGDNEFDGNEIADALIDLADSTLMQKPDYAGTIRKGITYGIAQLIEDDYAGTAIEVYREFKDLADMYEVDVKDILPAFAAGIEEGMERLSFADPALARLTIGYLGSEPELLAGVSERNAQVTALRILRSQHEIEQQNRSNFGEMAEELKEVPHLAFAIASLPESDRLITFTSEQTGSHAMVVEATPRNGLRVISGNWDETPQEYIASWLTYPEEDRSDLSVPCIFEGVARLTQSPYQHRAADAQAELQTLAQLYRSEWAGQLPETARTRIERVLPAPAAA